MKKLFYFEKTQTLFFIFFLVRLPPLNNDLGQPLQCVIFHVVIPTLSNCYSIQAKIFCADIIFKGIVLQSLKCFSYNSLKKIACDAMVNDYSKRVLKMVVQRELVL